MNRKNLLLNNYPLLLGSLASIALLFGCADDTTGADTLVSTTGTETSGDGDGDPATGDGDGDPTTTGDGDGDPATGDGDGDPTTTGDGDGDPTTTGDGDGDMTGDGDGDVMPMGQVRLMHLGVFPNDENTDVDIFVNGMASGITFAFKDGTDYVDLPVGNYTFDVVPTGGTIDDSVFTVPDFPIADGDRFEIWAGGYVAPEDPNFPFGVNAFPEDANGIDPGNLRLNIVHAAPLAAATPVDVWGVDENCNPVGDMPLIPNFNFGDVVSSFDIPAGPVNVGLDLGQDASVDACFFVPDLGIAGDFVNVFAVNDDAVNISLMAHLPDGSTAEVTPAECFVDDDCSDDCNTGTCNLGSCELAPANDGLACASGDLCLENGLCDAGACIEEQIDCSFLDGFCGVGSCDPDIGCFAEPDPDNDGLPCDDGDACSANEVCTAGMCEDPDGGSFLYESFANNDAGWTLDTNWEIGAAAAGCGDPGTDNSFGDDNGIAGVVLGGCAPDVLHDYYCLTSPIVDTTNEGEVWMTFYRDLWSDYTPYMKNKIEVFDGNDWVILFETFGFPAVDDDMWTFFSYDVSAYANADMQFRWCYNIDNGGVFDRGSWNVDDVTVAPFECDGSGN